MTWLEPGLLQSMPDRLPGMGPRQPRIDHGGAVVVDERVHVDVPQSGHPDRKLHAKDVLRDLADLLAGFLLLLASRSLGFRHDAKG